VTDLLLRMDLSHAWPSVRALRYQVGEALLGYPAEVRAAAMMTSSELVENAIKYGEEVPAAPRISFSLAADQGAVRIQVVNGATQADATRELQACVDLIARAPDREALYLARLHEICARTAEGGKLGLYRIAHEGGFDLRCTCVDGVVTVLATRNIS
jgi:hypothetical protein